MPAPGVTATASIPLARWFAYLSRADEDSVREGVEQLRVALDRVDAMIADGTIGREGEPTAADFQIFSTVAVLRGFADLREFVDPRPAAEHAERLFPRTAAGLPAFLRDEWLEPLRRG
jgi:glutathione S-transferase